MCGNDRAVNPERLLLMNGEWRAFYAVVGALLTGFQTLKNARSSSDLSSNFLPTYIYSFPSQIAHTSAESFPVGPSKGWRQTHSGAL